MADRIVAIGLVVAFLLAGCAAPTQDATPSEDGIEVTGGSLPADPDVVFDRVSGLMGADVTPPDTIRVVDSVTNASSNATSTLSLLPAFFEAVDVDADPGEGLNASEQAELENGATSLTVGTVTMYLGANDSDTVHYVLAHELAHYVQAARDRGSQLQRSLDGTTDASAVNRALLEGAAVYTTNDYIDEYIGANLTNSALYFDLRERLAPGSYARYVNDQYIHGWRYVSWRASSPNATDPIYGTPPNTTEQLIHRLLPGEEPPRPLSVATTTGEYRRIATDRLGEAFLRTFLEQGLDPERVDRAATGWGNDTLRTYRSSERVRPGYAWVLRFDDATNRTEFVAAARDSLSSRADRLNASWNLDDSWATLGVRTAGEESAVVLVGTQRFVGNTSVEGDDGSVELDLPGS